MFLALVGAAFIIFGLFLILIATDGRGGYGAPDDLTLGLGIFLLAIGGVSAAIAVRSNDKQLSYEDSAR